MRKARRPYQRPTRKRGGPPTPTVGGPPQPRRRTPLEHLPPNLEKPLDLLASPDRVTLIAQAEPMEQVVLQGYTREIEGAFQAFQGRFDEFWARHPELLEKAYKMEELLTGIRDRRGA